MQDLPRRVARHLYRRFVLAPLGYGWPVEQAKWDQEYQKGDWDFLYHPSEMAHHLVVLGYVLGLHKRPRVLEVGCGSGRFLDLFRNFPRAAYTGIDLSAEAIDKAKGLGVEGATFEVASFETWDGGERQFDVIVFDEVLWYARRPVDTLRQFRRHLAPGGAFVISMYAMGNSRALWRTMEAFAPASASTEVRNEQGRLWNIKVLKPKE